MNTETLNQAIKTLESVRGALGSFAKAEVDLTLGLLRREAEQPAQQQEPVAWMVWTHGPVLVFMKKDEADMEFNRLNHAYPEPTRMLVPLYTSPPASKPLTDEQIDAIWDAVITPSNHIREFVRAIEAAHGIKGDA